MNTPQPRTINTICSAAAHWLYGTRPDALLIKGKRLFSAARAAAGRLGDGRRSRIARLNCDGRLDATLGAQPDEPVLSVAVQADGKIVVGGLFTTVDGEA